MATEPSRNGELVEVKVATDKHDQTSGREELIGQTTEVLQHGLKAEDAKAQPSAFANESHAPHSPQHTFDPRREKKERLLAQAQTFHFTIPPKSPRAHYQLSASGILILAVETTKTPNKKDCRLHIAFPIFYSM